MLPRRLFLSSAAALAVSAGAEKGSEDISPTEDLMREHGVLRRTLLVYREVMRRIDEREPVPVAELQEAARLIRRFVEDYHEKDEEDFIFPRMKKAGQQVELVDILLKQHEAGRRVTAQIMKLEHQPHELRAALAQFVRMYEPHAAREDTVLFPAFRKLLTPKELDELGDEFEKRERQMFKGDGFGQGVATVTRIEQALGIHSLAQFTPKQ